jgi:hypothetical protein
VETSARLSPSGTSESADWGWCFVSSGALKLFPTSLLRARATFIRDGNLNPADYDEGVCRATACEVLARRIVHNLRLDRLESVMSTRFRYRDSDGDVSAPTSTLETAIDQHCTVRRVSPWRLKQVWDYALHCETGKYIRRR